MRLARLALLRPAARLPPRAGARALAAAAAALGGAWAIRPLSADEAREAAAAPSEEAAEAEAEPTCLQMHLLPDSSKRLLARYPPMHERSLADRVLLRPCVTEAREDASVRVLAYVEDGTTQSVLIRPGTGLWEGVPDTYGGSGYPVIPISIKETPELPPAPEEAEGGEEAAPATRSAWEEIEEPWRLLEASGVLIVVRGEDAMPTAVRLADGSNEWHGDLRDAAGGVRRAGVTLVDPPDGMELSARTSVPECGFCRFMRAGPCGDVFTKWEKCIDRARDSNADFVDLCGAETLALKKCTDQHPEYYGELSGGGDEE